jgi:hypothetical protein
MDNKNKSFILMAIIVSLIFAFPTPVASSAGPPHQAEGNAMMVSFSEPWTSPYKVDPNYPFHVVNAEGRHLFILNKTAWLYFG